MLLAINANNTNIKFALYDGDKLLGDWRIKTEPARTADEYIVWLAQLLSMAGHRLDGIKGAIIASVVPQAVFNLEQLCVKHLRTKPLILGQGKLDYGIKILIDQPDEVGADRIANAVGARLLYAKPVIVVDFGTATTFDVIDGEGNYCGGIIAPGINLSLQALHEATAKLPRIVVERPSQVIGRDTLSAMQSGIYWGYISLMEGLIARIQKEFPQIEKVIATGGLAPLFFGATKVLDHIEPEITMLGLREIYRRNVNI